MKSNNFTRAVNNLGKWVNRNSNTILTIISVGTSIGACVDIYKSAPIAKSALDKFHAEQEKEHITLSKPKAIWEDIKVAAPIMAPGVLLEAASIASCIGSYKISTKRIGALATAYKISESTLREYQHKVIERLGEDKHREIKEEIAKEHFAKETAEIVVPEGEYPCIDLFASNGGIAAFSTTEYKIRKAEMVINQRLRNEMWVSLNDFYYELGVGKTGFGNLLGWTIDKVGERGIEIEIGSILDEQGRPCLTIDYDCALTEYYDY